MFQFGLTLYISLCCEPTFYNLGGVSLSYIWIEKGYMEVQLQTYIGEFFKIFLYELLGMFSNIIPSFLS